MSMNPFDRQAPIAGIKKIVAVGSGKGGVGKSTVAVNLALALKEIGHKVGLLDADIYGPSIPRLMGAVNQPIQFGQASSPGSAKKMEPLFRHGIKLMSMGFLVNENQAVVWRGPMLFKAFEQFFRDVNWGELDYLVIDLPPGTGDVALTIAQKVPVSGAIVVTTPQNLALVDAKKAIDMFGQIHIPVLGVVENMAYFLAPGSGGSEGKSSGDGDRISLFPRGELDAYLDAHQLKKLAEIPFEQSVGLACEAGMPTVVSDSASIAAQEFLRAAREIA